MIFFLGTHKPQWLSELTIPLFVSHTRLRKRKTFPRASCLWALDSGAFSELSRFGRWVTQEDEYVEAVQRYATEIGGLSWAAPMDWMCEPHMLELTGKTVRHHQHLTTRNFLRICNDGPFIPVLQGWSVDDYLRHIEIYQQAGVLLENYETVGVGSVCRRQSSNVIDTLFRELWDAGLHNLHGFGVKTGGLSRYGTLLRSSDSMAWSSAARRRTKLPGCLHSGNCANCKKWALTWRRRVLETRL